MHDPDNTLTTPLAPLLQSPRAMLALTILWHPDLSRVGEQAWSAAATTTIALSRYAPLFQQAGGPLRPLEHRGVARTPLLLARQDERVRLTPPDSRMQVELNSQPLQGTVTLNAQQMAAGVVLRLGGAVVLCLHWMQDLPRADDTMGLLGVSSCMQQVRSLVRQVADTALPVLLLGETGSGKEVAARAIHCASGRRDAPLVAVNMAALGESLAGAELFGVARGAYTGADTARAGLFTEAGRGTLFLDEIGDAPTTIQPMLLRVLEGGDYRPLGSREGRHSAARVIAATDRDLSTSTPQRPPFNQPLLHRLESFVIKLPPLRQRREDIGLLILHFMQIDGAAAAELPAALVAGLCCHDWPGNVRQLASALHRAALALLAGDPPTLQLLLPPQPSQPLPLESAGPAVVRAPRARKPAELKAEEVLSAMEDNGWCIRTAARMLGISRPSMYKLLAAHPLVRSATLIPQQELQQALAEHGDDLLRCAAALKTPSEALRRRLRGIGHLPARAP